MITLNIVLLAKVARDHEVTRARAPGGEDLPVSLDRQPANGSGSVSKAGGDQALGSEAGV